MKIRAIALGLLVASAASAVAQTPGAGQGQRPGAAGRRANAGRPAQRAMRQLFRGIDLSPDERTKLQAVRTKYQPQLQAAQQSMQPAMREAREARQRGDTAALRAIWSRTQTERQQSQALLERMRTELRASLTPEHQKQFDANVARLGTRVARQGANAFRGPRRGARAQGARGRAPAVRAQRPPIARLQLSDAERTRVREVQDKYRPQIQTARASLRPAAEAVRAARQRGDTAAARAAFTRASEQRVKLQSLQEQARVEVRAALTPEHRQQLDSLRARRGARGIR